jgi:hypothetical protein
VGVDADSPLVRGQQAQEAGIEVDGATTMSLPLNCSIGWKSVGIARPGSV